MTDLWNDALRSLQPRLEEQTYELWLRPIQLREVRDDLLRLEAPNRFLKEWFETHYLETVLLELRSQTDREYRVEIEISSNPPPPNATAPPALSLDAHLGAASGPEAVGEGQRPVPHLHPRYRFDRFVHGASNELAASAALAVADAPGTRFNPLFIYGGVGLGKTHLLHAVGHAVHLQDPRLRVVYLSAEQFMNDFVTAVRQNRFDAFRAQYRRECDCLLIDDIQFIAGRERTMDEFFHVFNALYEAGKQIVVTSDRIPSEMQGMEARLTSRLNWGLVADIQAPDLETRLAILQQKAQADVIDLPRDCALTLAELVRSNVRELEGALLRVSAFAALRGVPITPEFIREVLGRTSPLDRSQLTVEAIQKAVATQYGIRIADLKGPRRHRGVSRPRMIAMYLARELTGASFPEIGLRFGGKDHSTVINACKRIDSIQVEDEDLRAAVDALRAHLLE